MRRGLIDQIVDFFRKTPATSSGAAGGAGGAAPSKRKAKQHGTPTSRPPGGVPARDIETDKVTFEYSPCMDGDPDPGEVVWTWVPYEEDPSQGKDRPVVIIGRRGSKLIGVPLTSKQHDNEPQVLVGTGTWDREGRPSYAKLERLLEIDPAKVRREGAVLSRAHFDDVVAGVQREQSR
jgi:hypothetical protein